MSPWLLLVLTVIAAFITYDALKWGGNLKDAPFSVISNMWKGGLSHLPLSEQNKIKNYYATSIFGVVQFQLIFLVITICLAVATVRAFINQA